MQEMRVSTLEQVKSAYRLMADKAKYRPAVLSDGLGSGAVPFEQLDLEKEAGEYADRWWKEEDTCEYRIGCCNFETRAATIFAVEAARNLCAGKYGNQTGLRLLKLALAEVEKAIESDERREHSRGA